MENSTINVYWLLTRVGESKPPIKPPMLESMHSSNRGNNAICTQNAHSQLKVDEYSVNYVMTWYEIRARSMQ